MHLEIISCIISTTFFFHRNSSTEEQVSNDVRKFNKFFSIIEGRNFAGPGETKQCRVGFSLKILMILRKKQPLNDFWHVMQPDETVRDLKRKGNK